MEILIIKPAPTARQKTEFDETYLKTLFLGICKDVFGLNC